MDGRNCSGRKISLLIESSDASALPTSTKIHLPPLSVISAPRPRLQASRESSCSSTSTPSLTPQTPLLVRSDSQDSSRGFPTPSPLTPSYLSFPPHKQQQFHHHHHQLHHHQNGQQHHQYFLGHHSYSKMDDQNASMYPPIPDATGLMPQAYPMPPMQMPQQLLPQQLAPQQLVPPQNMGQQFRTSDSPASEPSRASAQASNKAGQQPKKNQYPCPMAKQVGCTDFFTTSGHAARHAKKHTGKKDAFCPECNKAFTRKDNMEQHRRTHQNGRGASRASNDDSKVKKPAKQPAKKTTAKPEPHLEMALEQQLAEQAQQVQTVAQAVQEQDIQQAVTQQALADAMLAPTAGPYFLGGIDTGPIPALPMPLADMSIRPPLHRSSFANSLDFVPPVAPMVDPDTLHYSYPSPNGLTNGLNSLALAASEHSRRSEHASSSPSDSAQQARSPSIETPQRETP